MARDSARSLVSSPDSASDSVVAWQLFLLSGSLTVSKVGSGGESVAVDVGNGEIQVGLVVRLATQRDLGPVALETLASCCYHDPYPHNWKEGIAQAASRLRRSTGLPIARGKYRLELDPSQVDLLRFEQLAKRATTALSSGDTAGRVWALEALALWEQSPEETFADYPLLNGALDRFVRLHQRLYRTLAEYLIDHDDPAALPLIEEALASYPAAADIERLLSRALEIDPSWEVGRRSESQPVLHNLPAPDETPLVGRSEAFERVRRVLQPYPASQYPTLTIDGVGGVGKTALAKAVAYSFIDRHECGADGFDAVIWTSAKRTTLGDKVIPQAPMLRNLDDVYSAIATTLRRTDILAAPRDDHERLVRQLLSDPGRRVLLIVDNLETVDDERVLQFLRDLPAPTKAIITTRHRLDGAVPLRLEGLAPEDARSLAVAAGVDRDQLLMDAEIDAIATDTGGIPLAILWTIAQISKTGDPEAVLLRLRSASGDYAEFCFRDSLSLLQTSGGSGAVALLYAMSLFADGASREGAGFVAGLNDRPSDRDSALALLTDLSLANFDNGRFTLLPLTREFVAGELGRDLVLRERSIERWLGWHMQLTARAAAGGADLNAGLLDLLREEHSNVLWAFDFAIRHDRPDAYVPLIRSMEFFWLGEGLWSEFEHYLDLARTLAPRPEDKLHFTCRLIWLLVLREDFEAAEAMRVHAELLLRRYEVPYERMRLHDFIGQLYLTKGDLDAAEPHLLRSLALAEELGDRRGQFACSKYLGELHCARNDAEGAHRWFDAALVYVGDPSDHQWVRGLAHASQLQGAIAELGRDWSAAEAGYRECLRLLRFHPDARLQTKALEGVARSLAAEGDRLGAIDELREAKGVYERLGMWHRGQEAGEQIARLEVSP